VPDGFPAVGAAARGKLFKLFVAPATGAIGVPAAFVGVVATMLLVTTLLVTTVLPLVITVVFVVNRFVPVMLVSPFVGKPITLLLLILMLPPLVTPFVPAMKAEPPSP
jgi:hypothetical protein